MFKGLRTSFDRAKFSADEAVDFTDASFDLFVPKPAGEPDGDADSDSLRVPARPTFKHTTFNKCGANFTNAKLGFCVRPSPLSLSL